MNLRTIEHDKPTLAALILLVVYMLSIIYSKFLLSTSLVLLTLLAIYKGYSGFRAFAQSKSFISFIGIFALFLFSGVVSENHQEWLHQVKLKIPFLLLPFVFYVFRKEIAQHYYRFILLFISVGFLSALPILFHYFREADQIIEMIGKGQAIQTPIDHIKYSLVIAFAAICNIILIIEKPIVLSKALRLSLFFTAAFLFIFLHILAVRSGIAVFYLCSFFLFIRFFIKQTIKRSALVGISFLGIIGFFMAINTVPSLKTKIAYMKYDLEMYRQGKGQNYSDAERLYSFKVAWEIIKKNPIMGVGIGDLLDECKSMTQSMFQTTTEKYPHNMYLFVLSAMGFVGLIWFMWMFLYPWLIDYNSNDSILQMFYLLILFSFIVENTIQRSYSTGFFLFFALLGLCYKCKKKDHHC